MSAYNDTEEAKTEAFDVVRRTAGANGWSLDDLGEVEADIEAAYDKADAAAWWGADVAVFWAELRIYAQDWEAARSDELRDWLDSALVTVGTVAAAEEAQSAATILGGAVAGSAEDIGDAAKKAVDPKVLVVVGILATVVLVIALKR